MNGCTVLESRSAPNWEMLYLVDILHILVPPLCQCRLASTGTMGTALLNRCNDSVLLQCLDRSH